MLQQKGSRPTSTHVVVATAATTAASPPPLAPLEVIVSAAGTIEASPLIPTSASSSSPAAAAPVAAPSTPLSVAVGALTQQNAEWRTLLERIVAEDFVEREGGKAIDEAGYDGLLMRHCHSMRFACVSMGFEFDV